MASQWTGKTVFPWLHSLPFCSHPNYFIPPGLLSSADSGRRSDPPTCQDYFCLGAFAVTLPLHRKHFPYLLPPESISSLRSQFLQYQEALPDLPFSYVYASHLSLSTHQSIPCKAYSMAVITIWNHKSINHSLYSSLFFLIDLCPIHLNWMEEESSSMLIIAIFSVPKSVLGTQYSIII